MHAARCGILALTFVTSIMLVAPSHAQAERGGVIVLTPIDCPVQLPRPNVLYTFALAGKIAPVPAREPCPTKGRPDEGCGSYDEALTPWMELTKLERRARSLFSEGRAQLDLLRGKHAGSARCLPPEGNELVSALGKSPRTPEALSETILQARGSFGKCGSPAEAPALIFALDSQGRVIETQTIPGTGCEKIGSCLGDRLKRLAFAPVEQGEPTFHLFSYRESSTDGQDDLGALHAPLEGDLPLTKVSTRSANAAFEVDGVLSNYIVRRVIGRRLDRFRSCYARELRRDPELSGIVRVTFTIGAAGRVIAARTVGRNNLPAATKRCIETQIRSLRFPPPEGGNVTYTSPIIFHRGGSLPR